MAGFEGTVWAPGQLSYTLEDKRREMLAVSAGTPAVSRSVHYGLCLTFEGIRFFVREEGGRYHASFLNLDHNLGRFQRGIGFNLSDPQQAWVPSVDELRSLILHFLRDPIHRPFIEEMAALGSQGYLRPFTIDADQSIGVTFPGRPTIRIVGNHYESYLGEPFNGVAIPFLVRATRANGTGCLKLGGNYLMSVKAVQAARKIHVEAASALFLDDRTDLPLAERTISEWDSSCALIALTNGHVIRIPDSPLILPSVTVRGITSILQDEGVEVEERDMTYGELIRRAKFGEVATICSIGTAGILNRCTKLWLADMEGVVIGEVSSQLDHPIAQALGAARKRYWDIYRGESEPAPGLKLESFELGAAA
ncbi:MAG: hypothetical protein P1V51_00615 [Deltaproteobacteria bacterium]|nr:hypothetical protein [Deltaproteobacteria bacterium]